MSKLKRKFEEHLESLYAAVDGEMDLRDNYKLYRKVTGSTPRQVSPSQEMRE